MISDEIPPFPPTPFQSSKTNKIRMKPQEVLWVFFAVQVVIFRADAHILIQPLVGVRAAVGSGCEPPAAKINNGVLATSEIIF